MKPYADISDPRVAKALAHPLRTQILGALEGRTKSPSELADELSASLGVVSYHVRRLSGMGFIKLVKKTPRRGAIEHYYTATTRPRITDEAWASVPPVVKRATVAAHLQHVARHVNAAATAGGFDIPDAHLTRSPINVDTKGWKALARQLATMTERIQRIEAESAKRLKAADHEGEIEATVVLMLFRSAPALEVPEQPLATPPTTRVKATSSRNGM
jgi:DNA-binding transcriptional ArsR family regulator